MIRLGREGGWWCGMVSKGAEAGSSLLQQISGVRTDGGAGGRMAMQEPIGQQVLAEHLPPDTPLSLRYEKVLACCP